MDAPGLSVKRYLESGNLTGYDSIRMKYPRVADDARVSPKAVAIGVTAFLALLLGGGTALWAQAVLALAFGVILLIAPPRQSPGLLPTLLFGGLVLLALASFVPDHWLGVPSWKKLLTDEWGIAATPFRTLQPWLTLQSCGLFFLGLAWAFSALSWRWRKPDRLALTRWLVIGVGLLAALTVFDFTTGWRFPGWEHAENRGWFPNRNQTADVLALAGIVNYALLVNGLRQRSSKSLGWLLPLLCIAAALVVAYSRAGIILFFAGIALWHLGMLFSTKSVEMMAVAFSTLLVFLSLFLLFGGTTLDRFDAFRDPTEVWHEDFRNVVQKDAVQFSQLAPWLGVGLGNFDRIFAAARNASAAPNETLHPESDWLWAACEMGWPSVALLLLGLGWWLVKCLRKREALTDPLRLAALIAVLMFAVHGVVDVSGHRLGSAFFALLLAGLAMPSQPKPKKDGWFSLPARGFAMVLIGFGAWWTWSLCGGERFPTGFTLQQTEAKIAAAFALNDAAGAEKACAEALKIAPLDWQLYFQRGYARVLEQGQVVQIASDFQIARTLQPHWPYICLDEGSVWLAAGEDHLCIEAWQEALRRAGTDAPNLYRSMLNLAHDDAAVQGALRDLARGNTALLLVFLENASAQETNTEISNLLLEDPELQTLSPEQQQRLFQLWWQKGDRDYLARTLNRDRKWTELAWPYLAATSAAKNDYQTAWKIAAAHTTTPKLPHFSEPIPLIQLQHAFLMRPDDFAAGYALCEVQIADKKLDDALFTIEKLKRIPDHPRYLAYVEANLLAGQKNWQKAWLAWLEFHGPL